MKNSKRWILIKSVSILILLVFPIQLWASEGIFLSLSSARSLGAELKFKTQIVTYQNLLIDNYKIENKLLTEEIEKLKALNENFNLDKEILKKRGDELQEKLIKCNENVKKTQEQSPSRLTWFGLGFLSSSVISLILILMK